MFKIFSPYYFNNYSKVVLPCLFVAMLLSAAIGLYQALIVSPLDYQQGQMVRIMYLHVPAAWLSLGIYLFMAICSFITLVWQIRLCYFYAAAAAPIGAMFTVITLITGSLWAKPIWGTWWVWDARLTFMLLQFFIYLTYIIIINNGDNIIRAEKPASVFALLGLINIPLVKFSVDIWYSLHQPASILKLSKPSIHYSMMIPLIFIFISFSSYFVITLIYSTRYIMNKTKNDLAL